MIDTITTFLNQFDLDIRKSHDARFMVHQTWCALFRIV